jgi:hypothetical protein
MVIYKFGFLNFFLYIIKNKSYDFKNRTTISYKQILFKWY